MQNRILRTLTTEQFTALTLMRLAPGMVGLLDDPQSFGNTIVGHCAPEDETPHFYRIDTRTAELIELHEVTS